MIIRYVIRYDHAEVSPFTLSFRLFVWIVQKHPYS